MPCSCLMIALVAMPERKAKAEPEKAPPKAETEKAPAKAEPEKVPAAEAPPPADVVEVLDKMDAAGKDFKTVRAKFDYELNQTLYEDVQKRKGELVYRMPNLLRFEFLDKPQETFVFDGRFGLSGAQPPEALAAAVRHAAGIGVDVGD